MADKLQGYLNHECQLPLPYYQDGGVFTNYIKSDYLKKEGKCAFKDLVIMKVEVV